MLENTGALTAANRLGLDYEEAASDLPALDFPITDVHAHINGSDAARLYRRVMDLYGIETVYSMTQDADVSAVQKALGSRVRFIAIPDLFSKNPVRAAGVDYQKSLPVRHAEGVRIAKFWSSPRSRDLAEKSGAPATAFALHAPHVMESMRVASDLGMVIMVHIADPDTWFQGKYSDTARYGTKRSQYDAFERCLDKFPNPFIAAHMGGWPEDLNFLSSLLERHDNLHLDTSATKWMVREVSRHSRDTVVAFVKRWQGRLMFGSDIVTADSHLNSLEHAEASDAHEAAFDLYASRYWALRTLWETDYDGESPIADPDLHMISPQEHTLLDAPRLKGVRLPNTQLRGLYHDAAASLLGPLHA